VSGIPDAGAAIGLLSPKQQVSIGLACNDPATGTPAGKK
jgi:hypothetical protein